MDKVTALRGLVNVLDNDLFTTNPERIKSKDKMYKVIDLLCRLIHDVSSDESVSIWDIGENGSFTLVDFIIGSYWYFTDYHKGQWSIEYQTLSKLGEIFSPNCSTLDDEPTAGEVYKSLETWFKTH